MKKTGNPLDKVVGEPHALEASCQAFPQKK
jgi:hypothetical protein